MQILLFKFVNIERNSRVAVAEAVANEILMSCNKKGISEFARTETWRRGDCTIRYNIRLRHNLEGV